MTNNIKVHNVVASGAFDKKVPLSRLSSGLKRTEYEPEQFPGLVYRLENPKAAALIFNSGKIVCTGTKSVDQAHEAVANLLKDIQKLEIDVTDVDDLTIQNMVASTFFTKELNLNKIAFELEGTEYEPEQFPGLVYRMDSPKVVFLLFKSGKVICTGAKSHEMIEKSVEQLRINLEGIDIDLGEDVIDDDAKAEDKPESKLEDKSEDKPIDKLVDAPEDKPDDTPEDKSEAKLEDNSEDTPKDKSKGESDDTPDNASEDKSDSESDNTPEDTPEDKSEAKLDNNSKDKPEAKPAT